MTLLNSGKAANFLKSGTPEEVMDIVFAELFRCIEILAANCFQPGRIHELGKNEHQQIAASWLRRHRKHESTAIAG